MGLLPVPKPQGNAAPLAAREGGAPEAMPPEQQDEESNVSPEEQAQYETFVTKAADIIYGEGKVMPEILEALSPGKDAPAPGEQREGGNPAVIALANTAVQVIQKLDVASHEANAPVSDDVLYHGGVEVIEMLAEVAEAAGIHAYTEEELNGALFQAVDDYRPIAIAMGRTNDETLKGQFSEALDADAQGRLGDLLPGMGGATMGEPPVQAEEPQ